MLCGGGWTVFELKRVPQWKSNAMHAPYACALYPIVRHRQHSVGSHILSTMHSIAQLASMMEWLWVSMRHRQLAVPMAVTPTTTTIHIADEVTILSHSLCLQVAISNTTVVYIILRAFSDERKMFVCYRFSGVFTTIWLKIDEPSDDNDGNDDDEDENTSYRVQSNATSCSSTHFCY